LVLRTKYLQALSSSKDNTILLWKVEDLSIIRRFLNINEVSSPVNIIYFKKN